ncbi:hypothetical protein NUU61_000840 [Penicillium alfredii]|uniref:Laccase n=1 Tax=Penicillium alfredii TaxID=1506179 RepID=A0A9W9KRE6_9EURO|nr:uncharacterized protein NUU61_000840 [Penicillium alfredii]KAJ5115081.1 hypothetical protein NUU61_000840 [Penicillium alfredii]
MRSALLPLLCLLSGWTAAAVSTDPLDLRLPHLAGELDSATSINVGGSSSAQSSSTPCEGNTPQNRQQWCEHDIHTDYTTTIPDGATREFWFELDQGILSPDGRPRWVLAINGSIPGPTIEVNWGDTVIIHLRNNLPASVCNGTSMHFHGIRQLYTNPMDGVVSLTQCPIAPGHTMTYRWRATQYGTTWYHSHIGLQTWEGVFGGIIIHGPASANYDEDKGVILLNDWDARTVDELWDTAQRIGAPTVDSALINGTNVFGADTDHNQTGYRFNTSFASGKKHRLRLGNAACDTHFKFSIDHHALTVIATDLVPIKPYTTNVIDIAIGQRYDVIVHANQAATAEKFWLRAVPQTACSQHSNVDNIRGIVSYDGASSGNLPNTTAHAARNSCDDEDAVHLVPIVSSRLQLRTDEEFFYNETLPATASKDENSFYRWHLNGTSMHLDWADPMLMQISDRAPTSRSSFPSSSSTTFGSASVSNTRSAVIALPRAHAWVLIIIETTLAVPHPIHLHGHDFLVVSQGTDHYQPPAAAHELDHAASTLPKRDTALLPAAGHLVLAFRTDNPGAWLLHCHIGWHLEQGFALQFVEREPETRALLDADWADEARVLRETCRVWTRYWTGQTILETGSGV